MRRRSRPPCILVAAISCLIATSAAATTLKPITDDEQIEQAAVIFRGRVEAVDAWRDLTKSGSPIVSAVRLVPLATYKGTVPNPVTLKFLGGRAGGAELRIDGMPQFEVGREYVLFVSADANRLCPVIGWSGGSLPVAKSDARAGTPAAVGVSDVASQWLRRTPLARSRVVMPASLDLPQFESLLRNRIAAVGASK